MVILAGSFSVRVSIQLFHGGFLLPWVKKNKAILCLKGRDYNSSSPIRYIPKKSSNYNKLKNPPSIEDSERNGVKDADVAQRSNHFYQNFQNQLQKKSYLFNNANQGLEDDFDSHMEFDEGDFMKEPEGIVQELSIHEHRYCCGQKALPGSNNKQDAEQLAIKLLATRAFTVHELSKKLHGKKFSPDTVEAVINDLNSRGLINDSLYAETFSRSRWSSSSWGPRRIKQGIREVDAEKAIQLVFEDGESGNQGTSIGLSKLSVDHLYVQVSKQWLRGRDAPRETRKARIIRWLQYRGFDWGTISFILKKLESQYPP